MEDFIRLNINFVICSLSAIVINIIALIFILKLNDKSIKKVALYIWFACILVSTIVITSSLLSQLSVNQLSKSKIDREYTNQSQDSYQQRVLKNAKEK